MRHILRRHPLDAAPPRHQTGMSWAEFLQATLGGLGRQRNSLAVEVMTLANCAHICSIVFDRDLAIRYVHKRAVLLHRTMRVLVPWTQPWPDRWGRMAPEHAARKQGRSQTWCTCRHPEGRSFYSVVHLAMQGRSPPVVRILDSWRLRDIIPQDVVRAHHDKSVHAERGGARAARCRVTIAMGAHAPALMEPQRNLALFFKPYARRKETQMAEQPQGTTGPARAEASNTMTPPEGTRPNGLVPDSFDPEYVAGAVAPFLLSGTYVGERPSLPMIDLTLSKEKAVGPHIWGLIYDGWAPDPEEEGVTVFLRGYEHRGPHNERKRIYVSAVTPDL